MDATEERSRRGVVESGAKQRVDALRGSKAGRRARRRGSGRGRPATCARVVVGRERGVRGARGSSRRGCAERRRGGLRSRRSRATGGRPRRRGPARAPPACAGRSGTQLRRRARRVAPRARAAERWPAPAVAAPAGPGERSPGRLRGDQQSPRAPASPPPRPDASGGRATPRLRELRTRQPESRLPGPGLTLDHERRRAVGGREERAEPFELTLASDDLAANGLRGHQSSMNAVSARGVKPCRRHQATGIGSFCPVNPGFRSGGPSFRRLSARPETGNFGRVLPRGEEPNETQDAL